MNNKKHKAYITASSLMSACGDKQQTLDALFAKQSALIPYDSIVPEKTICIGKFSQEKSFEDLLISCVKDVLIQSALDTKQTLLLVGSSVGGMANTEKTLFKENSYKNIDLDKHPIEVIASTLDAKFGFISTRSFSTACTSSANALKTAKELLECGAYENILVVGADEICATTIFGFSSLGILSDSLCTPFQNNRKGMNVAEGIAVLLLQNQASKDKIALLGAGTSSDAYHIANPDPSAAGAIKAIQNALKDASLEPQAIDYINAHGTGTQANDAAEAKAILTLFGSQTPISSSKSSIGHTLGAAGAMEAIICTEVLKRQTLAPQIFSQDNETDIALVSEAKEISISNVLSNSFAFGGNNTSLVFGVCHED